MMMKMRTIRTLILLLVVFLSSISVISAQDATRHKKARMKSEFMQRASFGGYLGLQFGTVTLIDVSPLMTYKVTERFYTGIGLTYQYINDKRWEPDYSTSAYGGTIFIRYHVWQDLFVQGEYDPLYLKYYYDELGKYLGPAGATTWVHDIMIGAGYRQWLGERAFATIIVLFNINETYFSPYNNPIIRIGFGIGL